MKAIDFICNLFTPRKSVGSIIRNKVLDEVIDAIHIDSVRVYKALRDDKIYTPEFRKGYHEAIKQSLLITAKLRK